MLTIAELRQQYLSEQRTPAAVVAGVFERIDRDGLAPIWISLADRAQAITRATAVDPSLPLGGVPFAVKDNIDVEGMITTAGCPSFAYRAERTATVVTRLLDAGAILIGKTNLDQFATGLVGTRSPYGACSSVFDARYISGGSSSGSAVAVARGLCAFALGTDTAGSGRVPAAFNNLVGLKPSRGLLSTSGIVPACRSLDCVSIFSRTASDAALVWQMALGFDSADPYSRVAPYAPVAQPWVAGPFRFGVPAVESLVFFGDEQAAHLFSVAAERLEKVGGRRVAIDFAPFHDAGALLYAGPWVAERVAAVGDFLADHPADVHPVVGEIIRSGATYSAVDAYRAAYQLEALKRDASDQWDAMDVLLVPTTGTIYTTDAVYADPVGLNTNLGYYTNFVNLMDLCAIAVPAGFRTDGLPFGVSLIGPAFSDAALVTLGRRFLDEPIDVSLPSPTYASPRYVSIAVVGAHLTGEPLNHELTDRGARLVKACRTSKTYRLFALQDTTPPKPGLVRERDYAGPGIELEVWAIPEDRFGGFVAAVPLPLAIGNVELDTGEWVKGFICEPFAVPGAEEITHFGGWLTYRASRHLSD